MLWFNELAMLLCTIYSYIQMTLFKYVYCALLKSTVWLHCLLLPEWRVNPPHSTFSFLGPASPSLLSCPLLNGVFSRAWQVIYYSFSSPALLVFFISVLFLEYFIEHGQGSIQACELAPLCFSSHCPRCQAQGLLQSREWAWQSPHTTS